MRLQTDPEMFLNGERVAGLESVNEAWVCMNENQDAAAKKLPQVVLSALQLTKNSYWCTVIELVG
jgi:hypothetical protein